MKKDFWVEVLAKKKVYSAVFGTQGAKSADDTGAPFVTLTNGGIKKEGFPCPAYAETEDEAVQGYCRVLDEYTKNAQRVVFRSLPRVELKDDGYVVYSRLTAQ